MFLVASACICIYAPQGCQHGYSRVALCRAADIGAKRSGRLLTRARKRLWLSGLGGTAAEPSSPRVSVTRWEKESSPVIHSRTALQLLPSYYPAFGAATTTSEMLQRALNQPPQPRERTCCWKNFASWQRSPHGIPHGPLFQRWPRLSQVHKESRR